MFSYDNELSRITNVLRAFVNNRKIETDKLDSIDTLISFSNEIRVKTLNLGSLTLEEEISLFDATTNIKNTLESMKAKLQTAFERHENPTTAELALEIMPSFRNLEPFIDDFVNTNNIRDIDRLNEFSRILHKKAHKLGFYKDIEDQFQEVDIKSEDVQEFIEQLKNNIEIELDIQTGDELNENIDRQLSSN
jgi:hypothetical protein